MRKNFVETSKKYIGCKESNGTHKQIIDIYNKQKSLPRGYKVKYTDSWCATFVSAMSIMCGYTSIIPVECSCQKMIEKFMDIGCWKEKDSYTPSVGDIIFYDWNDNGKGDNTGWADHVGIVEKVVNGTITVIEGNYNNAVKRRNIYVDARYIRGYGVPKYKEKHDNTLPSLKGYKGYSIVDGLKSFGYNSSFDYRKKLWSAIGKTSTYKGTSLQNMTLLNTLKK